MTRTTAFFSFVAVVVSAPIAFVAVVAFLNWFGSAARQSWRYKIALRCEIVLYVVGVGLPGYVAAGFHHDWMMALATHGIAIVIYLLTLTFQNSLEAYVFGLLWAVLLASAVPIYKEIQLKEAQLHQLPNHPVSQS